MEKTRIYLDNAATTAVESEVLDAMIPYFMEKYGNPSSIYRYGRETRMAVENSRRKVADLLGARPAEIFFTSCGTESTNTAIMGALIEAGCTHIISSPIEHHATLHTVQSVEKRGLATVALVNLLEDGQIDLTHLELLLKEAPGKTLVTLMHANNEIGNISDVEAIGKLTHEHGALFHSDMVQTIGHLPIKLSELPVDFVSASAHKFHGPKGSGMLYINSQNRISPFILGGGQERNMRAGTENVTAIIGFSKALEIATERMEEYKTHISALKAFMKSTLAEKVPGIRFTGSQHPDDSLYTVLPVAIPGDMPGMDMLLINLDIQGVCVSGGSACSSGASKGSHVVEAVYGAENLVPVRFSFSHQNTREELEKAAGIFAGIVNGKA